MKNGWQTKTLGDLCEIELGKTPARANASFWDEKRETSNVWLSIADLLKAGDNVVVDSKEYVSDKGAAICKLVPKGTLLVSFKLTLGRLAFAGRDLFTNEAIAALTIFNERELSKEFLFYCLTFFDWVKAAENDVKLKGMTLNKAKLKVMPVSFPPLAEQQRIVGLLDDVFEGLATAKANAEKNLQNARALFESHLQSVFTQRGPGWNTKTLAEVCKIKPPKSEARDKVSASSLVSFVPMEDMGIDVKFVKATQTKPLSAVVGSYTYFADGDVLLAKITPCFENGKLGIANGLKNGIGFGSSEYFVFRPDSTVSKEWLYYFLSRETFRLEGAARMSGAVGHKRVSKEFIEDHPIPVPPLAEQQKIGAKLDRLAEETQHLARLYERKLAALEALKKSLLQQAFTGEL